MIIIGLVGRSIRSHAVSTRDIASRRSALRGFDVAIRISSLDACASESRGVDSVNVTAAQAPRKTPSGCAAWVIVIFAQEHGELRRRYRPAVEVSLHLVAAVRLQRVGLGERLHAFGDHAVVPAHAPCR